MPDDAYEVYRLGKYAGCESGISGGAAQQVILGVLRGFDIVQGDGSGDDD